VVFRAHTKGSGGAINGELMGISSRKPHDESRATGAKSQRWSGRYNLPIDSSLGGEYVRVDLAGAGFSVTATGCAPRQEGVAS
jgi:hypothetical protein